MTSSRTTQLSAPSNTCRAENRSRLLPFWKEENEIVLDLGEIGQVRANALGAFGAVLRSWASVGECFGSFWGKMELLRQFE